MKRYKEIRAADEKVAGTATERWSNTFHSLNALRRSGLVVESQGVMASIVRVDINVHIQTSASRRVNVEAHEKRSG